MDTANLEGWMTAVLVGAAVLVVAYVAIKIAKLVASLITILLVVGAAAAGAMTLPDLAARNADALGSAAAKAGMSAQVGHTAAAWCGRFATWRDETIKGFFLFA